MPATYSYRQYGNVALINENDRAICTATFENERWTTWTYPMIGQQGQPRHHGIQRQSAKTLDALLAVITVQIDRACPIEQFGVEC